MVEPEVLPDVEPLPPPLPDVEPEPLMPPLFRPPCEPFVLPRRPPEVVLPEVEPAVLMLPELPEVLILPELPEVEPPVEPIDEPLVLPPVEPVEVCACAVLASKPRLNKKAAVRSGIKMCFFIKKREGEKKN